LNPDRYEKQATPIDMAGGHSGLAKVKEENPLGKNWAPLQKETIYHFRPWTMYHFRPQQSAGLTKEKKKKTSHYFKAQKFLNSGKYHETGV
jgi:hypothetical protein